MIAYKGNQVGCTLRVRMCGCVVFSLFLSLHMLGVIYFDFRISIQSCHANPIIKHLTVIICGNKMRNLNYKASGIYITKSNPLKNKIKR